MGQEIKITIKIATAAEGNVVSTIQSTDNEDYDIEVPSVEMMPDRAEGEISEPPAYGQMEEAFGAEPPPPEIEAIPGMFEGQIPDPPTYELVDEAMQGVVPPPKVDPTVGMDEGDVPEVPTVDEIYEADEAVIPVPEIGEEVPFEVFEDLVDADVPPVPT